MKLAAALLAAVGVLRIADCGLRIDFGFDPKSAIQSAVRNPQSAIRLSSPNGSVSFALTNDTGQLRYSIAIGGETVIEPSPVGIVVDGANLGDGVEMGRTESYNVDAKYTWYGVHSTAVSRCGGARIALTHAVTRTAWRLEAQACNDGAAFIQRSRAMMLAIGRGRVDARLRRTLRGRPRAARRVERERRRLGGAAADVPAAGLGRLRVDHRVVARRIFGSCAARRRRARLCRAARTRRAGVLSLSASLQAGRHRASRKGRGDRGHVVLRVDGTRTAIRNDAVIVQIGGTAPSELLRQFGIGMITKRGEA